MKKKILTILICLVMVLATMPSTVFASSGSASIYADVNPAALPYSNSGQTVTMTVSATAPTELCSIYMTIPVPSGWSIASISNSELGFTNADYNILATEGVVFWQDSGMENKSVTQLCQVTFNVPGGAAAGTYSLSATGIDLRKDINVKVSANSSVSADFTIYVSATGVEVSPKENTVLQGNTVALSAKVTPENAGNKAVNWSSSDTSVATVDGNGLVTGVSKGTATITATTVDGGYTDSASVKVIGITQVPKISDLSYNGNEQFPADGEGYTLSGDKQKYVGSYKATAYPADGYAWADGNTDRGEAVSWNISPEIQPANVTETANLVVGGKTLDLAGLVSGMKGTVSFTLTSAGGCTLTGTTLKSGDSLGTAMVSYVITGADENGDGTKEYMDKSGTITVNIVEPPTYYVTVPEVTGGSGSADPASGKEGTEVKLSATAAEGYKFVRWDVSGAAAADPTKADTTLTIGESDVTATPVFEAIKPSKITVEDNNIKLYTDGTDEEKEAQIVVKVTPEDALDKDVTFTSDDPSVVKVDEDGKVTAVGTGTATITITSKADPSVKTTVKVRVLAHNGGSAPGTGDINRLFIWGGTMALALIIVFILIIIIRKKNLELEHR
ncbi:MAG: Ig-like domain-containing protein [Firmicutes bacterium]|nr:Ig-like domain-containing protein [Bacillota bacterium]